MISFEFSLMISSIVFDILLCIFNDIPFGLVFRIYMLCGWMGWVDVYIIHAYLYVVLCD